MAKQNEITRGQVWEVRIGDRIAKALLIAPVAPSVYETKRRRGVKWVAETLDTKRRILVSARRLRVQVDGDQ